MSCDVFGVEFSSHGFFEVSDDILDVLESVECFLSDTPDCYGLEREASEFECVVRVEGARRVNDADAVSASLVEGPSVFALVVWFVVPAWLDDG